MKQIHFSSIDSTNKYLIDNYLKYDDFTFVSTDYQTNGKGRENRKWHANDKENLLFSFLLKKEDYLQKYQILSISVAAVIMKILNEYGLKNVSIKWPNDVYVNDKKICGILLQGKLPNYLVVGVGLNVNQINFDDEYRNQPTSMSKELNKHIDIEILKNDIYNNLNDIFSRLDELIEKATQNDYLVNKNAYINNEYVEIIGIQKDGSLKIIKENQEQTIVSGEVEKVVY